MTDTQPDPEMSQDQNVISNADNEGSGVGHDLPGNQADRGGDQDGGDRLRELLGGELAPATLRSLALSAGELAVQIEAAYKRLSTVDPILSTYWQSVLRIRLSAAADDVAEAAEALETSAADLTKARACRAAGSSL
jgi:hypothetical protein